MDIKDLVKKAHEAAKNKGFYDNNRNIGELLMLIVSELSEALEALRGYTNPQWEFFYQELDDGRKFEDAFRNNIKDTFQDEIADSFIRLADLCGYLEIDIEKFIEAKMKYNESRDHKHGKKY